MSSWLVGFCAAPPGECRVYRHFLKPGFVHCWAARHVGGGHWLWLEWNPWRLLCFPASPEGVSRAVAMSHEVLEIAHDDDRRERARHWPIIPWHNCASIIAHALGIASPVALTPWRLCCALRKRGAVSVLPGAFRNTDHGRLPEHAGPERGRAEPEITAGLAAAKAE